MAFAEKFNHDLVDENFPLKSLRSFYFYVNVRYALRIMGSDKLEIRLKDDSILNISYICEKSLLNQKCAIKFITTIPKNFAEQSRDNYLNNNLNTEFNQALPKSYVDKLNKNNTIPGEKNELVTTLNNSFITQVLPLKKSIDESEEELKEYFKFEEKNYSSKKEIEDLNAKNESRSENKIEETIINYEVNKEIFGKNT